LDKKTDILKAALTLFVQYGFHATPTSKIAQKAGVANGTLFHYYKTKDELIVALFLDIKTCLGKYMYESFGDSILYKDILKNIYQKTLIWGMANKTEFNFIQQFHNSPFISLISNDEIAHQAQLHLNIITKGIKKKQLKNLPVKLIYTLISSHTFGVYQYLCSINIPETKQKKVINQSFELIWEMIKQ